MEIVEISACYVDQCQYNNNGFCDHTDTYFADDGGFFILLDDNAKCKNFKMIGSEHDD